jgi:hypothetical protein
MRILRMRSMRSGGRGAARARGSRPAGSRGAWRRAAVVLLPLLILAGTLAPSAISAQPSAASVRAAKVRAAQAAHSAEEREQRLAAKRREAEARRIALRERRLAATGTRVTPYGHVEVSCTQVTYFFSNSPEAPNAFSEGSTTTVTEVVSIDGERLAPVLFTFFGSSGSNTIPITVNAGLHRIDALARWSTNGVKGANWDIPASRTCEAGQPAPGYSIEKLQAIAGTGQFVPSPLTGEVGQTVDYKIVVTNTGNEPLTMSNLSDPNCEPGTITGGPGSRPLEIGAATIFRCTHVLTPADRLATSYSNTATITGTPAGGTPITTPSNTVVVNIPPAKTPEPPPGGPVTTPTTSGGSSGAGNIGVLASSGSRLPRLEALGTTSSAPGLNGRPEGCVRSSFLVSVKAKGVKSVTFYLDGHRLKTLTAKSARKGRLSFRIRTAHLKVGVHRLKARITIIPTTASTKTVTVTRSLKFARCASATLSPKFTG